MVATGQSGVLQGYLNVWLDSNQDGDWNDTYDCSGTAQGAYALDHIAINRPINPASLAEAKGLLA